jgi:ABC-type siderophore export system fused ATPase/permease subunit
MIFSLLLTLSVSSFSQDVNTSQPVTSTDFLQKSKDQNTAAWVLLGLGSVTFIIITASTTNSNNTLGYSLNVLFIGGGVASLLVYGSIPLFFAAHKNKKKAMSLSFKNETAPQIQKSSFVYKSVPSLTLKINL